MLPNPELAIFRQFYSLNMLRIMSLQAELVRLETEYHIHCDNDDTSNDQNREIYTASFHHIVKAPSNCQQEDLIKINKKLDEYNQALIQVAQVRSLCPPPSKSDLKTLRYWLTAENFKRPFPREREAKYTWSTNIDDDDFITLTSDERVPFVKAFQSKVIAPLFELFFPMDTLSFLYKTVDETASLTRLNQGLFSKVLMASSKVIASMLPVLVMIVLYTVNSVETRLGLTVMFSGLFSTLLLYFTSASLTEIFTATAAFAAVEVVFIGSTLPRA